MSRCLFMETYSMENFKYHIIFDNDMTFVSLDELLICLYEERMITGVPPVCSWIFDAPIVRPTGVTIDLTHLDIHSVRLTTIQGRLLSRNFQKTENLIYSSNMRLEVNFYHNGVLAFKLQHKLHIPTDKFRRLEQRMIASQTQPIEWFFVELTNKCNFQCDWCPQKKMTRPLGEMLFEKAKQLLNKIAAYKEKYPIFSLYAEIRNPVFLHIIGEPLMYPQLFDIIEYGHSIGLDFCLITNGSLLSSDIIEKIMTSRLQSIVLSLNTPDAMSFKQTHAKISYDKLVNQIQHLITERYKRRSAIPRIEIQLLNTKNLAHAVFRAVINTDQVKDSLIFWSDSICEHELKYQAPLLPVRTETDLKWKSALDEETYLPGVYFTLGQNLSLVFKEACNFANSILPDGYKVRKAQKGQCPFRNAHHTFCIFWDGSCSFCTLDYDKSVNLGNVFEQEIETIWKSRRMNRIRALMENQILIESLCQQCQGTIAKEALQ